MSTDVISVSLITQGNHRFYSGTMDIDKIASTCTTNPRESDPLLGFQRTLDIKRAEAIADYVQAGGTIPSSIILSAQEPAQLVYSSTKRSMTFQVVKNAFLILDGQHRVYGFQKLLERDGSAKYRIPVIIYQDLTPMQEASLFIDINTLQRPVPKELLLDIKKLALRENAEEEMLDLLFTHFEEERDSFLLNRLSRFDKKKDKISKVTFYDSLRPIIREFNISNTSKLYRIINSYFHAAKDISDESGFDLNSIVTKPIVFKILIAHSKSVISLIWGNNPDELDKISEHKKYLMRSLPGSLSDLIKSTSYVKGAETLDKKLIRRNVSI